MGEKIIGYIYSLTDPRCSSVKYIGRTRDIKIRVYAHFSSTEKQSNPKKHEWISELKSLNLLPIVNVIKECYLCDNINRMEYVEIAKAINSGAVLFNLVLPSQSDFNFFKMDGRIMSNSIISKNNARLLIDYINNNIEL